MRKIKIAAAAAAACVLLAGCGAGEAAKGGADQSVTANAVGVSGENAAGTVSGPAAAGSSADTGDASGTSLFAAENASGTSSGTANTSATASDIINGAGSGAGTAEGTMVGIANPWTEYDSLAAAEAAAGVSLAGLPAFNGYENLTYRAIEGELLEVIYRNAAGEEGFRIRKGTGSDDISGDYEDYAAALYRTPERTDYTLLLQGDEEEAYRLATWVHPENGAFYAYAISAKSPQDGQTMLDAAARMTADSGAEAVFPDAYADDEARRYSTWSGGRYLSYDSDGVLIILQGHGAVVASNSDAAELFEGLHDGDLVWVLYDTILETYPGSADFLGCEKVADGTVEDIDADELEMLRSLGYQ